MNITTTGPKDGSFNVNGSPGRRKVVTDRHMELVLNKCLEYVYNIRTLVIKQVNLTLTYYHVNIVTSMETNSEK